MLEPAEGVRRALSLAEDGGSLTGLAFAGSAPRGLDAGIEAALRAHRVPTEPLPMFVNVLVTV